MNRLKTLLLAASIFGVGATGAIAAINNSHHDLSAGGWGTQSEVCYPCHGVKDTTTTISGFGNIGTLCMSRCHGGNIAGVALAGSVAEVVPNRPAYVMDNGTVNAIDPYMDVLKNSHKFEFTKLVDPKAPGTAVTDMSTSTFPYTSAPSTSIECTSCHNVHSNQSGPFLRTDLFTGGPAAGRSFCERCHTERTPGSWHTRAEAPSGEHPVNFTIILGTVTSTQRADLNTTTPSTSGRVGRYIQFDKSSGGVAITDVASPIAQSRLNDRTIHYVVGGKVQPAGGATDTATAVSGTSRMGCYTCHAAHQSATPSLVVRNTVDSAGTYNPLCVSCHGPATESGAGAMANINEQNPGLTGFYHPLGPLSNAMDSNGPVANSYNYYNSVPRVPGPGTGTFTFAVSLEKLNAFSNFGGTLKGGVQRTPGTNKILCTSCHDVHGGGTGTMAVANLAMTAAAAQPGAVCYQCHDGIGLADAQDGEGQAGEAANVHHRTHRFAGSSTVGLPTETWATTDPSDPIHAEAPTWSTATSATGDYFGRYGNQVALGRGGLDCPDCHMFNGTAHNW